MDLFVKFIYSRLLDVLGILQTLQHSYCMLGLGQPSLRNSGVACGQQAFWSFAWLTASEVRFGGAMGVRTSVPPACIEFAFVPHPFQRPFRGLFSIFFWVNGVRYSGPWNTALNPCFVLWSRLLIFFSSLFPS